MTAGINATAKADPNQINQRPAIRLTEQTAAIHQTSASIVVNSQARMGNDAHDHDDFNKYATWEFFDLSCAELDRRAQNAAKLYADANSSQQGIYRSIISAIQSHSSLLHCVALSEYLHTLFDSLVENDTTDKIGPQPADSDQIRSDFQALDQQLRHMMPDHRPNLGA